MTGDQILGQLQTAGLIDATVARRIQRDALVTGDSIEAIISRDNIVADDVVAETKSALIKVPYKKIDSKTIDEKLFEMIPEDVARTYAVIPLSLDNGLLVVGMFQPDDTKAQDAIKFIARRNRVSLGVYLISFGDWQAVLKRYSPYRTEISKAVESLNVKTGSTRKITDLNEGATSEDAPIVKIVADTFREAVANGASDVHIEPQEKYLRIRFRIDGDLIQEASLPSELSQSIISRIKVMSNLKIDETRVPQDGRFRTRIFDKEVDFRVGTFPTASGEKIAIRVLDPSTGLKSFDKLSFLYRNLEIVKAGLEKPFGMVLITGPTGSGKTTTLYAFLQEFNKEDVNIISLEDPVEYFVSGINQSQVHPEIGYDFASGLREILRQDPDVVMVGEIRDGETAALAVQAALTGQIVLSTLHTNNAAGVIPRLIDMKVEPFLIPVSVNLMIAQRLLGTLCPTCKAPETAPENIQNLIARALADLPDELKQKYPVPYQIYHAKGCATCKGKGVKGRDTIFEAFMMTPELENIVNDNPNVQKIAAEAKRQGMLSLRQDGIVKALEGMFSIEEVIRETEEA